MKLLATLWHRLSALFQRRKLDRELDEELRFHIEKQTEANIEAGMTTEEARYAALRKFGWMESVKETCRDVRDGKWIEDAGKDLSLSARRLIRTPGFTTIVVLTLAIGIGGTTALFSLADRLILNPVPGQDARRLIRIQEVSMAANRPEEVSAPVFMELLRRTNVFESITAIGGSALMFPGKEFPEQVRGVEISPGLFEILRARPFMGRSFRQDEGAPWNDQVMVISHRFWQRHYGADPDILGKTVSVQNGAWTIVGVMPPGFAFPQGTEYIEYWKPHLFRSDEYDRPMHRLARVYIAVGRLRPNVSIERAQALLDLMNKRMSQDDPTPGAQYSLRIVPARFMFTTEAFQRILWSLLVGMFIVLVITCANTAGLLLVHTETRQKELAVRMALGASRQRIFRHLLTESILLSLAGGLSGLLVAWWGIHVVVAFMPGHLPHITTPGLDWRMYGCAAAVALLSGIGFGVAPAWKASHTRLNESLKQTEPSHTGSLRRRYFAETLVVLEIALGLVLLAAAGLVIHSVAKVLHADPGCDPRGLVRVLFSYPSNVVGNTALKPQWNEAMAKRLKALPGVESATLLAFGVGGHFKVEEREQLVEVRANRIEVGTNNCFRTLKTPLLAGRFFESEDAEPKANTIIVNQELARLAWPGQSPVGKRIARAAGNDWLEVVGLVGNVREWELDTAPAPIYYEPFQRDLQIDKWPLFVVRTAADPALVTSTIRALAKDMSPSATAPDIIFVDKALYSSTALRRTYMWVLTLFGVIGLMLAALGIYGLLTYWIAQRTREIGIRMAFGATRGDMVALVLGRGSRLILAGVAVGVGAALLTTRFLRSQLYETSALEPLVFALVVLVLFLVAIGGCYLPARRASRVDPAVTLRHD